MLNGKLVSAVVVVCEKVWANTKKLTGETPRLESGRLSGTSLCDEILTLHQTL